MFSGGEGHLPGQQPLVGREYQLQRLDACWTEVQTGCGQLALITGESGIGKTSLARQFAAQSRAEVVPILLPFPPNFSTRRRSSSSLTLPG
ncbi:MAG: hypothetical protein DPW09_45200 [Anaerolineae bacterium]|nr:hypothetical protein [Anaerolineae bacterium]